MPEHNADLVILGGGSGGYACALRAAELGMSVVLVERDKLGGTCLHSGCIPTKALLHAAEVADAAREGDKIGVKSSLAGIDMAGVNSYKDGVVAKLYKGLQGLVKSRKINFVAGDGTFVAPNAVEVDGDRVRRQEGRAGHRQLRPLPARPRDRRPDHHQHRGHPARLGARSGSSSSAAASSAWSSRRCSRASARR